jgi:four helix bundle protein
MSLEQGAWCMEKEMKQFRFQDFEIWRMAIEIADKILDVADGLEGKHLFKFAEQLRSAALSISNNIAEGAGSASKKEFSNFLNFAKRSAFECANILIILNRRQSLKDQSLKEFLDDLEHLCRKISNFRKTLLK